MNLYQKIEKYNMKKNKIQKHHVTGVVGVFGGFGSALYAVHVSVIQVTAVCSEVGSVNLSSDFLGVKNRRIRF